MRIIIEDIFFVPMKQVGTFIGFVSFRYDSFAAKGVEVHETGVIGRYRLEYPIQRVYGKKNGELIRETKLFYPITREFGGAVETAISDYLNKNWDKETKTIKNQHKIPKRGSDNGKSLSNKEGKATEGRIGKKATV